MNEYEMEEWRRKLDYNRCIKKVTVRCWDEDCGGGGGGGWKSWGRICRICRICRIFLSVLSNDNKERGSDLLGGR